MKKIISAIAILVMVLKVSAQAPTWTVTPSDYQFTATITAVVVENGEYVNTTGNTVAALVNGEVRGVANATAVSNDQYYFITVYSNEAAGEEVSFKFYSNGEDSIYNVLDTIEFSSNATFGAPDTPYSLRLNELVSTSIDLSGISDQDIDPLMAFSSVALNDYLTHSYSDPVTFTVETDELIPVITDDTLYMYVPFAGWNGSDEVIITAQNDNRTSVFAVDTAVYSVTVNGLNKVIEAESFELYPNPVYDQLSIKLKGTDAKLIELFNSSGALITSFNAAPGTFEFSMKGLPAGVYYLSLKNEAGIREYSLINHVD